MYPTPPQQPSPLLGAEAAPQAEAPAFDESQTQLLWPEIEERRLLNCIQNDVAAAKSEHCKRLDKAKIAREFFRGEVGGAGGEQGKSNYSVPLIPWQILGKLAKEIDALLGDDAEAIAKPTGPEDSNLAPKVGLYMTWLVFDAMDLTSKLIEFVFNKLMFGRTHAYVPYEVNKYFDGEEEVVESEMPGFYPLEPEDFVVPAEKVRTLHEFSWVARCYSTTLDELLTGEEEGRYRGIRDNWRRIYRAAQGGDKDADDNERLEQQGEYSGVDYANATSAGESIRITEWYGNWRVLLNPNDDAGLEDFDKRDIYKTPIVVRVIESLSMIVSIQSLDALYPKIKDKRPFVEASLTKTGDYWGPSLVDLLKNLALEMSKNFNLSVEAGEFSIAPLIGVRRQSGAAATLDGLRYEPRTMIELDNPQTDINPIYSKADLQYPVMQEQRLLGYAERVTGLSDQSLGRSIDRPNAPKTARGQILLDENANVRLGLDVRVLRDDFRVILRRIWELDSAYSPPQVFFRVTEEKAEGLFDSENGFASMTADERGGRYDFDIRLATSAYSREAAKERELMLAQVAMSTPLIQQSLQAQWHILNDVYKANGKPDFKRLVPKPPEQDVPMTPEEEYNRALQGLNIHTHPLDQDDEHIMDHQQGIAEIQRARNVDTDALNRLIAHVLEHEQQKKQKLMVAAAAQAMQQMAMATGMMGEEPGAGMVPEGANPMASGMMTQMGGAPNGGVV